METEAVAIDSLTPDPDNARSHNDANLRAIKRSLERFGQQKPIVVDANNVIVAGNGTWEAARSLGWDAIDVVRTSLVGAEAAAFAIADNRTAELAAWDASIGAKLVDLENNDVDVADLGFAESDVEFFRSLENHDPTDKQNGSGELLKAKVVKLVVTRVNERGSRALVRS